MDLNVSSIRVENALSKLDNILETSTINDVNMENVTDLECEGIENFDNLEKPEPTDIFDQLDFIDLTEKFYEILREYQICSKNLNFLKLENNESLLLALLKYADACNNVYSNLDTNYNNIFIDGIYKLSFSQKIIYEFMYIHFKSNELKDEELKFDEILTEYDIIKILPKKSKSFAKYDYYVKVLEQHYIYDLDKSKDFITCCSEIRSIPYVNTFEKLNLSISNNQTASKLDPDVYYRTNKRLSPVDETDEENEWKFIFELVRAGQLEKAKKLCKIFLHDWRAIILCGSEYYRNDRITDSEGLNIISGNKNRQLWRQVCLKAVNTPNIGMYERAVYSTLIGHVQGILPICKDWLDCFWAYCIMNRDIIAENTIINNSKFVYPNPKRYANLRHQLPTSKLLNLVDFSYQKIHNNDPFDDEICKIYENIINFNETELLNCLNNLNKVNAIPEFLTYSVSQMSANITIFLALTNNFIKENNHVYKCIIDEYINELVSHKRFEYVALYSRLFDENHVCNYVLNLRNLPVQDMPCKIVCLKSAYDALYDLDHIVNTICTSMILELKKTKPIDFGNMSQNVDWSVETKIDPISLAAIDSLDWLILNCDSDINILIKANELIRYFLLYKNFKAINMVVNSGSEPLTSIMKKYNFELDNDCSEYTHSVENDINVEMIIWEFICFYKLSNTINDYNDWNVLIQAYLTKKSKDVSKVFADSNQKDRKVSQYFQNHVDQLNKIEDFYGLQPKFKDNQDKDYDSNLPDYLFGITEAFFIDLCQKFKSILTSKRKSYSWLDCKMIINEKAKYMELEFLINRNKELKTIKNMYISNVFQLLTHIYGTTGNYAECLNLVTLLMKPENNLKEELLTGELINFIESYTDIIIKSHNSNSKKCIDFIATGAAAGVAPVAGLLFTIEEASSSFNSIFYLKIYFCCIISALSKGLFNSFLYYKDFKFVIFHVHRYMTRLEVDIDLHLLLFPMAAFIGLGKGIMGSAFTKLNIAILRNRNKMKDIVSNLHLARFIGIIFPIFIVSFNSKLRKVSHKFTNVENLKLSQCHSYKYLPNNSALYKNWLKTLSSRFNFQSWTVLCIIGILTGFCQFSMHHIIDILMKTKWKMYFKFLYEKKSFYSITYLFFFNIICIIMSSIIVIIFAPTIKSSSVPYIICYLNGTRCEKFFTLKNLIIKYFSSVLAVSASMPLGVEGPMIFIGAVIAYLVHKLEFRAYGRKYVLFNRVRRSENCRDFIMAGACAGITSSFSAPVGGLLFAMEESTSHCSFNFYLKIYFCCIMSALSKGIFNSSLHNGTNFKSGLFHVYRYMIRHKSTLDLVLIV
ncbi:hypothetical protein A3Q56_04919 [Intoshia linei]|uniref:Uncharacterized protein n=1 Tax=Intoshia linei TaxID=1819745 RepID=A0A177B0U5_9BILA|nr:hypothetical protein A3Q56_04919 [Intoshia linei]